MNERTFFVYLLASRRNGTLYCGVTNDLLRRVSEHRAGTAQGFTRKYRVTRLVWFETHSDIGEAILREKRIKGWNRAWKIALIEAGNAEWRDLAEDMGLGRFPPSSPRKRGPMLVRQRPMAKVGPRIRGDDRVCERFGPVPSGG